MKTKKSVVQKMFIAVIGLGNSQSTPKVDYSVEIIINTNIKNIHKFNSKTNYIQIKNFFRKTFNGLIHLYISNNIIIIIWSFFLFISLDHPPAISALLYI